MRSVRGRPLPALHDRVKGIGGAMDVFYIGLTLAFFALSWGLIKLCERL
jgi:hypothetical protein